MIFKCLLTGLPPGDRADVVPMGEQKDTTGLVAVPKADEMSQTAGASANGRFVYFEIPNDVD